MDITQSVGGFLTPYAFEIVTVAGTAIGFTAAKIESTASVPERDLGKARLIVAQVESQTLRYRYDGSDPVATSSGMLAVAGTVLSFANLQAMRNFRAIKEGGSNSKLQVTFLR